ncbi:MAG: RICIN domain-containing protein [Chloroflexi bacterium AL-W]|nr:RICIN domain-containing protein [Chloroflexi bacterium AL-N1]NOK67380.1 RICIN domain-containing protein [Chloroflexi bacterium AL-N10]NOK75128.1 RICIN domain-containing protein [Chloroflexi bacterium AL-N5]NOK81915.1 RICIN domain-containing protein [Chloroflexi bacterium AL-W]NOK89761.1 RICIN domain-containing protein [Chloroflexi bacterium AL-N15]
MKSARFVRIMGFLTTILIATSVMHPTTPARSAPSTQQTVWGENFERLGTGQRWFNNQYTEVRSNCGVNNSKCVRVRYVPFSGGSERVTFKQNIPPAKSYTLNYDVMFERGFEFVRGGKLHGLGPANPVTGCRSGAADRWSARTMFSGEGEPYPYLYKQERENRCGTSYRGSSFRYQTGKYHAVSLFVQVNDPNQANGRVLLYVDGRLIEKLTDIRFRSANTRDSLINTFMFSTFHGGSDSSWSPSKAVYARFDNFAVDQGFRIRSAPGKYRDG